MLLAFFKAMTEVINCARTPSYIVTLTLYIRYHWLRNVITLARRQYKKKTVWWTYT